MDLGALVPAIRDFIVQELTRTTWAAEMELKEYLAYKDNDVVDAKGNAREWYEKYFPESVQLAHSYNAYQIIVEHQQQ